MRTESRFEQYDLNITLPPPLIPRCDRFTLDERIDAGGRILRPADEGAIAGVVDAVAAGGYESVAIGFLHSYVNDAHECRMRDALQQRLPQLSISISAEVSPQMREYERFNTVCANAYVKPIMKSYLDRLVQALQAAGATCPLLMMHSGGGIISVETAAEFPVRLVESGPAGGAIFAADIARRYQLDSVLSFDMGGTTAKICLIEDFEPKTARTFEVARTYRFRKGSGMPISIPVVEMVEIGAGGGSIACGRRAAADPGRPAERRLRARPCLLPARWHAAHRHRCGPAARPPRRRLFRRRCHCARSATGDRQRAARRGRSPRPRGAARGLWRVRGRRREHGERRASARGRKRPRHRATTR